MKHLTAIIAVIIGSILVGCNQKIKQSRLFVPKQIQWDTLKGGFEDDKDLYYKSFDVLYINNDTIFRVTMDSQLYEDSIHFVTPISLIESFKIIEHSSEILVFIEESKRDTLLLNQYTDRNISRKSCSKIKKIIYCKEYIPEVILPD